MWPHVLVIWGLKRQTRADPGLHSKPVRNLQKKSKWEFWRITLEIDLFWPLHTHTHTWGKETDSLQKKKVEHGYLVRPCFKRQNKTKARREQKINSHRHIRYAENNPKSLRTTLTSRIWWYIRGVSRSWPQRFHPRNVKKCAIILYDDRLNKYINK